MQCRLRPVSTHNYKQLSKLPVKAVENDNTNFCSHTRLAGICTRSCRVAGCRKSSKQAHASTTCCRLMSRHPSHLLPTIPTAAAACISTTAAAGRSEVGVSPARPPACQLAAVMAADRSSTPGIIISPLMATGRTNAPPAEGMNNFFITFVDHMHNISLLSAALHNLKGVIGKSSALGWRERPLREAASSAPASIQTPIYTFNSKILSGISWKIVARRKAQHVARLTSHRLALQVASAVEVDQALLGVARGVESHEPGIEIHVDVKLTQELHAKHAGSVLGLRHPQLADVSTGQPDLLLPQPHGRQFDALLQRQA